VFAREVLLEEAAQIFVHARATHLDAHPTMYGAHSHVQ
jgi:hypothetical protein